ncbi:hypothetical protein F2Q70_00022596 [Brassica cretica]|uniref:Uncharacterized protein n=1 Tax=Brassica cretica TaxID=69181 RepID=A0A8S9GTS2_BRACR|nr:hypothetical protein F2Q70_00022596 [Brassica cretica]
MIVLKTSGVQHCELRILSNDNDLNVSKTLPDMLVSEPYRNVAGCNNTNRSLKRYRNVAV